MADAGKVDNDFVLKAEYQREMDNLKGREINLKLTGYEAWILFVNLHVGLNQWEERGHTVVNIGQRIHDDLVKVLNVDNCLEEALNNLDDLLDKRR